MKLIREPENVEFEVDTRTVTTTEKKQISDVIAFYKKTGKVKKVILPKRKKTKEKELT